MKIILYASANVALEQLGLRTITPHCFLCMVFLSEIFAHHRVFVNDGLLRIDIAIYDTKSS